MLLDGGQDTRDVATGVDHRRLFRFIAPEQAAVLFKRRDGMIWYWMAMVVRGDGTKNGAQSILQWPESTSSAGEGPAPPKR